jgi:tyrosine-protein kinase Etk/Wzc
MATSVSNLNGNIKQQSKLSIKELFLKYSIYLPLIVVSVAIAIGLSYVYLKYQSPIYSSSIAVYFPDESKGGSGNADASVLSEVLLFDKKVNLTNEIQVLKSKSLMARVVQKLNLNLLFYKKGKTKLLEYYKSPYIKADILSIKDSSRAERIEVVKNQGQLYFLKNDVKTKISKSDTVRGENIAFKVYIDPASMKDEDKYIIIWQPVLNVASGLSNGLVIYQPQTNANILNYVINTEVPEKGVDILNNLVLEHNLRNNEQKDRLVNYTLQFIDERVELMRGELGKVESGLQSLQQSSVIAPRDQTSIELGEMGEAKATLDNSEVKLRVINMVKQAIATPNQPISTTLGIDDAGLSGLVGQYNQAIFGKEEQLRTMPAANPMVRSTQASIDKLRSSILNNLDNISVATSQLRKRSASKIQTSRSSLSSVPGQERRLLEVSREQEIKEKLFLFLLQKKEEAAITKASQLSSNSIPLDAAITTGLISPDSGAIYKTGIFLALLIPVLLIYLKELLNDKITTRSDVTSRSSIPIIGEVIHNSDQKRRLVVSFDDRSVMGEQFRMMRANIPLLTKGSDKKVILVTSTTSGEGKTFCSLNLGAVYAVAGKRTVILEMDLRKPKVTEALNIPSSLKGLTHYISDQATLDELPIAIPNVSNLYIIPAGIIPPNPSEILMDAKMDTMFQYLKEKFDCVIIDSAPLGLVSDAKILAKHAQATLYVVRQRKTPKKQLGPINELHESNVFPNFSLIINDVKAGGVNSYYGYGNDYLNNYRYSYGNEKKKTLWEKAKTVVGL